MLLPVTAARAEEARSTRQLSRSRPSHVGTTVTWTNCDDIPHVCAGKFAQSPDTDGTFSFTFTEPGEYKYFCSLHPHMTGTIKVG